MTDERCLLLKAEIILDLGLTAFVIFRMFSIESYHTIAAGAEGARLTDPCTKTYI